MALFVQSNDMLVAALVIWALVFLERPALRGALILCAALTKFLPALLILAFAAIRPGRWRYLAGVTVSGILLLAYPLLTSGPADMIARTFIYQNARGLQFSFWSEIPWLAGVGRPALALALAALAASALWRPQTPGLRHWAALAGALLIGAQLLLGYWSYLYIAWFFPLLIIAFVAPPRERGGAASAASPPPR